MPDVLDRVNWNEQYGNNPDINSILESSRRHEFIGDVLSYGSIRDFEEIGLTPFDLVSEYESIRPHLQPDVRPFWDSLIDAWERTLRAAA